MATEYWQKCSFTLTELNQTVELQRVLLEAAKNSSSKTGIERSINLIGAASTLLALVCANITSVGISTGLYSIISQGLNDNYFQNSLQTGLNKTIGHLTWFVSRSSQYKRVEFEVAFIEYNVGGEKTRYIMQAAPITRLQLNDGTWISST